MSATRWRYKQEYRNRLSLEQRPRCAVSWHIVQTVARWRPRLVGANMLSLQWLQRRLPFERPRTGIRLRAGCRLADVAFNKRFAAAEAKR